MEVYLPCSIQAEYVGWGSAIDLMNILAEWAG
jgi:hypothetical protein